MQKRTKLTLTPEQQGIIRKDLNLPNATKVQTIELIENKINNRVKVEIVDGAMVETPIKGGVTRVGYGIEIDTKTQNGVMRLSNLSYEKYLKWNK